MHMPSLRQLFLSHRAWPRSVAVVLLLLVAGAGVGVFLLLRDASDRHDGAFEITAPVPADPTGFAGALLQTTGAEMRGGHRVELVDDGAVFDAVVREVERARVSVNIVMYIWESGRASDRVVAALAARAREGVRCRVVVDALGSPDFEEEVKPALDAAGCESRVLRPLLETDDELARNHRKVVVVDGRTALVGGFGVRDNWLGGGPCGEAWRDSNVVFEGPAVRGAQVAFTEGWVEAGGQFLPAEELQPREAAGQVSAAFLSSTGAATATQAERLVQLLILSAQKRLWIANAYFVPPRPILEQLKRKAREGVDVRLLVPGKKECDSKTSAGAQYIQTGPLLEAGVRIWEYKPKMMHSKTMLADDRRVVVGSINIEPLSFNKLDEVALIVDDPATNARLAEAFERDTQRSEQLRP